MTTWRDRISMAGLGGALGAFLGLVFALIKFVLMEEGQLDGKLILSLAAGLAVTGFFLTNFMVVVLEGAVHFLFGLFSVFLEADLEPDETLPRWLKIAAWSGVALGVLVVIYWQFW